MYSVLFYYFWDTLYSCILHVHLKEKKCEHIFLTWLAWGMHQYPHWHQIPGIRYLASDTGHQIPRGLKQGNGIWECKANALPPGDDKDYFYVLPEGSRSGWSGQLCVAYVPTGVSSQHNRPSHMLLQYAPGEKKIIITSILYELHSLSPSGLFRVQCLH